MIRIKNDNFNKAIEDHPQPKSVLAIFAGSSTPTLNKIMDGDTEIQLAAAEKIAEYVGLGVEVSFFPLPKEGDKAAV